MLKFQLVLSLLLHMIDSFLNKFNIFFVNLQIEIFGEWNHYKNRGKG